MLKLPVITCLALIIILISLAGAERTYIVSGSGPANYKTINDAIARASSGDTIYVKPGIYNEEVIVGKTLTIGPLIGEKGSIILEGKNKTTGMMITADGCSVEGLIIRGFSKAGIELDSNGNNIRNNQFQEDFPGILIYNSSGNRVEKNSFKDCFAGVVLWHGAAGNYITDNTIGGGNRALFTNDVGGNTLSNNVLSGSSIGLYLTNATGVVALGNKVSGGTYGILADNISRCSIGDSILKGCEHGIFISETDHLSIYNNSIKDGSFGILMQRSSANGIQGCTVDNVTEGIGLGFVIDSIISGCSVSNIKKQCIGLVNSRNNTMEKNQVNKCTQAESMGIMIRNSPSNRFHENALNDVIWGLYVEGKAKEDYDNTIDESNTIDGKPIAYLCGQSGKTIRNRELAHLTLAYCQNCFVAGNTITNDALFLSESSNNKILGNNVSRCYGIYINRSLYNDLVGNTLYANRYSGIYLINSDDNQIRENHAYQNSQNGISLANSQSNNLSGNLVELNSAGIWLNLSNSNRVVENNITSNQLGIFIANSIGNQVYHNNFISNKEQAEDKNGDNSWDTGNVTGGNYWSDRNAKGNPSTGWTRIIRGLKKDNHPFENLNGWKLMDRGPSAMTGLGA